MRGIEPDRGLFEEQGSGKVSVSSRDEVSAALNQWGRARVFRAKGVGNRIHICELKGHPCRVVGLQTHYERRSETTVKEPYGGGLLDDCGRRPGMWELPVQKPEPFVEGLYEQVVPHTDKVEACSRCGGRGRINCEHCLGRKYTPCPNCGGGGSVTQGRTVYGSEWRDGHMETTCKTEYVQVSCSMCGGVGRRTCPQCGGCGDRKCPTCSGYGKLKSYQVLTVVFAVEGLKSVVESPEAVKVAVTKVTGEVTYQQEKEAIASVLDIGGELYGYATALLEQAKKGGGKVLRQRLEVQAIPVTEVLYRGWFGGRQSLWIYGSEKAVLGDWWLLTNWWAVTGAAVIGVGAAALLWTMVGPTLPGSEGLKELVKKEPGPTPKEKVTPKPATAPQVKPSPKVSSSPKGNAGTHGLELPKGGQQPKSGSGSGESDSKVPESGATQNSVLKPSSSPPAEVVAFRIQCHRFGQAAVKTHDVLKEFDWQVIQTANQLFAEAGAEREREAVEAYRNFLDKRIGELKDTDQALRAVQLSDQKLAAFRDRYAGLVEQGVELMSGLRETVAELGQKNGEEFNQGVAALGPVVKETGDRGTPVQRGVADIMLETTTYCLHKY